MTTSIQNDNTINFVSVDGDKSISISNLGLNFKRDLLTTPIETIITPLDITDVNTGNSITFDNLTYLPIGLAALEAPPNLTTLHIQDTLLVDKLLNTVSNTLTNEDITIIDTSTNENVLINKNSIFIKDKSIGYTSSSAIEIENNNSTLNNFVGVPSIEYYKSGRIGATADIIMSQQFNALNYLGAKTTFGKIECSITSNNVPGSGGVDGAIDFYTCVNGSNNNVFRLNGNDNENNTFRPFDLNGNQLKTSQGNIFIDATASSGTGGININSKVGGNITLNSAIGNINLDAPNINSFNYAMPICFDIITLDRNSGNTTGGQIWDNIWIENANLPSQFFVDSPISGYTSSKWRLDFSIQTWAGSDNGSDKALAYYIDFEDQNTNIYDPILFNKTYPFCCHNNNSTWSGGGGPNTNFQPFTWTDYVDFSGLSGTSSSNLPLKIRLWFTSDNTKNFQFSFKLGLTRTNLLSP